MTSYIAVLIRKLRSKLPGPFPLPIIGNIRSDIGICQHQIECFKKYGNTYEFYEGYTSSIVTRDPEFTKKVCVKEFTNFHNRRVTQYFSYVYKKIRMLYVFKLKQMGKDAFFKIQGMENLFTLNDDEWKNNRSILSAVFTGGKLKSVSETFSYFKLFFLI